MTQWQLDLKQVTADDWSLWRTLRLRALEDAPYAFGSKLADWQGSGDREERWRERLSSVPFNLIAVLDHVSVAMVSATRLDRTGITELISLWVEPSSRGCGIGDALVAAVIRWAEQQKALCIALDVGGNNEHAKALYRRHGFIDAGASTSVNAEDAAERRFIRKFSL